MKFLNIKKMEDKHTQELVLEPEVFKIPRLAKRAARAGSGKKVTNGTFGP